jgi:hypothetical protein
MTISKCCGAILQGVHSLEGTNYYRCNLCKKPCDIQNQPTPYIPQIGDRVSVQGEVAALSDGWKTCHVEINGFSIAFAYPQLTLLSRPTPKRKITRKELEEGFEIVD